MRERSNGLRFDGDATDKTVYSESTCPLSLLYLRINYLTVQ